MPVGRERVHINWFRGQLMMMMDDDDDDATHSGKDRGPVCDLNRQSLTYRHAFISQLTAATIRYQVFRHIITWKACTNT